VGSVVSRIDHPHPASIAFGSEAVPLPHRGEGVLKLLLRGRENNHLFFIDEVSACPHWESFAFSQSRLQQSIRRAADIGDGDVWGEMGFGPNELPGSFGGGSRWLRSW